MRLFSYICTLVAKTIKQSSKHFQWTMTDVSGMYPLSFNIFINKHNTLQTHAFLPTNYTMSFEK